MTALPDPVLATVAQRLLNAVPTWPLVLVAMGSAMSLAMLGNSLVQRWLVPRDRRPWEHNLVVGTILAVVTGLYGLLLAFLIVSVWEDYRSTEASVHSEATALAQVLRDTDGFPEGPRVEIWGRVEAYVTAVIDHEWDRMSKGKDSPEADARLYALFSAVESFEPSTPSEVTFHAEAARALNDAVSFRRDRLFASASSLPEPLAILIVMGAVVCVGFLYFLRVPNRRAQAVPILSVTGLLAFELVLALLLSNPFSGDVAVESRPLADGRPRNPASQRLSLMAPTMATARRLTNFSGTLGGRRGRAVSATSWANRRRLAWVRRSASGGRRRLDEEPADHPGGRRPALARTCRWRRVTQARGRPVCQPPLLRRALPAGARDIAW